MLIIEDDKPISYEDVLSRVDKDKWLEAMNHEMKFMYKNKVSILIDPFEGVNPIAWKWVFKKKTNMGDNVISYKVTLVAKDYNQEQGVDFE